MPDRDDGGDQESQLEPTTVFDRYQSLFDPAVTSVVAKDVVRPFVSKLELGTAAIINRTRFCDNSSHRRKRFLSVSPK
jgi:hypothetical protein